MSETIKKIVVSDDEIIVHLCDGNSFALPRITVNGRGKKIMPWSEVMAATDSVDNLDGIQHYTIIFHGGNESKVLLDTEDYSIELMAD